MRTMEIILMEKVDNLGDIGDVVRVKPGYARNYLLPQGKGKPASPENVAELEARRAELENLAAAEMTAAQERAAEIEKLGAIQIAARAGEEGKLFGSVGPIDIADKCAEVGVTVGRSEIRMLAGPIRVAGEYDIEVHLHADVNASLKVEVIAEEGSRTDA